MLTWPDLRRWPDVLFIVASIALTADVLVPEIWGNGKTKDYALWYWAGQQVLHGGDLYTQPADGPLVSLSTSRRDLARDTVVFRQAAALHLFVSRQRRCVVDDGAILARHVGLGADTRSLVVRAPGPCDNFVCFRHVRSRTAQPFVARDDAVRLLVAPARTPVDGRKHVCARHGDQGFPGRRASLSGVAKALVVGGEHGGVSRSLPVRTAGARARFSAKRRRTADMVPRHGGIELGAGVRTARRAELVVGQSVDHCGDAPADAGGQLQPGQSEQAAGLHERARSGFQNRELDRRGDFAGDRVWIYRRDAGPIADNAALHRRRDRHPFLSDDGGLTAGPPVLFHMALLSDHRPDPACCLRSSAGRPSRHLARAGGCGAVDVPVASDFSE